MDKEITMSDKPEVTINLSDDLVVNIFHDGCGSSPRAYHHADSMICWHNRYFIGDWASDRPWKHPKDFQEWWKENGKEGVIRDVRAYIHSGISLSITSEYPYNDQWDSMQIGYIFMTAEQMKDAGVSSEEDAVKVFESSIREYNLYLSGEIWRVEVSEKIPLYRKENLGTPYTEVEELMECSADCLVELSELEKNLLDWGSWSPRVRDAMKDYYERQAAKEKAHADASHA